MGSVELGHRLRAARGAQELSLRDVRAATGLSPGHLQRLERGEVADPRPETLRRLSRCYGVPYVELMRAAGHL